MAKRAEPGATARCPWCEAAVPHRAGECPSCRFPLTMDGARGGATAPPSASSSGTSSTATPPAVGPGRPVPRLPAAALGHPPTRAQRLRVTAWLLGLVAVLLVLAGATSVLSLRDPERRGDQEAIYDLRIAHAHTMGDVDPAYDRLQPVGADVASDRPSTVSVDVAGGLWFGAAQSPSGTCFVLGARLDPGSAPQLGTLAVGAPCTAAEARARLQRSVAPQP